MPIYLLRVWLDDRPGALGSIASRIGAVRGDLVGIEILERGGGRAIDELVVELPTEDLVDLMVREIMEVDGVDVEDVRRAGDSTRDARVSALQAASSLVEQKTMELVLESLVASVLFDFESEWAVVIDPFSSAIKAEQGDHPGSSWLSAFLGGASLAKGRVRSYEAGPHDVAWAEMTPTELVLVVGRVKRPYRAVERDQLVELAKIAGIRFAELKEHS